MTDTQSIVANMLIAAGALTTPEEVLYFLEKPSKYQQLADRWVQSGRPWPLDLHKGVEHNRICSSAQRCESCQQEDDAWQAFVDLLDQDEAHTS